MLVNEIDTPARKKLSMFPETGIGSLPVCMCSVLAILAVFVSRPVLSELSLAVETWLENSLAVKGDFSFAVSRWWCTDDGSWAVRTSTGQFGPCCVCLAVAGEGERAVVAESSIAAGVPVDSDDGISSSIVMWKLASVREKVKVTVVRVGLQKEA
ncbi:unnamed protein product [Toxocara canis]|uniref:DUF4379 domain-containing protein n=1 Tax=Toxocara canis TaxID=6265 RepID=A0A183ULY5_TOXCA|nr:unnamed protein product [Toxocara canis]